MDTGDQQFHANVELPCKMFREVESIGELAGTVVSIDTRSLSLRLRGGDAREGPKVGESMRLELQLPVNAAALVAGSRCLSLRAKVVTITDQGDGSQMLEFKFRKASFKNSIDHGLGKNVKTAGWRM